MLAALRAAGFEARGFDTVTGRGDDASLVDFADGLTTLITVVRDQAETDEVLFTHQAFTSCPTLENVIISSTLSPRYTRDLRARVPDQIHLIDAPMSGAQVRAQAATLTFMLGGDTTGLMPLFEAMGQDIHHMGDFGAGMAAKVLNNMLAATSTAMTRLVLDWADAAGINERQLLDLIDSASGQNWLASGFDQIEFARDGYARDNSIGILAKDIEAALDMAPDGADIALPRMIQAAIKSLKPRGSP